MQIWNVPMYTPAMASRLVKLGQTRVKRWLRGYDFTYSTQETIRQRHQAPVISRGLSSESHYASFLDLIDLLFVKRFLDHGISLQKLRRAMKEAEQILDGHHFAQRDFFTDGKRIYLDVKGKKADAEALLELLSGGQWVIAQIIKQLAQQVVFDDTTGYAKSWYPLGRNGLVVLDPQISFGRPALVKRGIATVNIYDLFLGENENVKRVCSWMRLEPKEVSAAVAFESQLKGHDVFH